MVRLRDAFLIGILLIASVLGCNGLTSRPAPLSSPLFTPTPLDTLHIATLTHKLNNEALHCFDLVTCEQVHFARALVSLFENQEAARASFRRVIEDNPSTALAASSTLWLQLIGEEGTDASAMTEPQKTLAALMAESVRDWMNREVTQYTTRDVPAELPSSIQKAMVEQSGLVQGLQRQVRERERRIAILESKLDALKVIDQDHENRVRAIRIPTTLP